MIGGLIISGTICSQEWKTGDDHMISTIRFALQDHDGNRADDLEATVKQLVGAGDVKVSDIELVTIDRGSWEKPIDKGRLREVLARYYTEIMLQVLPFDIRSTTTAKIGGSFVNQQVEFEMEEVDDSQGAW